MWSTAIHVLVPTGVLTPICTFHKKHTHNLLLLLDDVGELRVGDAGIELTLHQCCPLIVLDVAQVAALGHLDVLGEALGRGSRDPTHQQDFSHFNSPSSRNTWGPAAAHAPSPAPELPPVVPSTVLCTSKAQSVPGKTLGQPPSDSPPRASQFCRLPYCPTRPCSLGQQQEEDRQERCPCRYWMEQGNWRDSQSIHTRGLDRMTPGAR